MRIYTKSLITIMTLGHATLGLAAGEPSADQANSQAEKKGGKFSLLAGHNVVDAVDDVRETTADLLSALLNAGAGMGYNDWDQGRAEIRDSLKKLDSMEKTLDAKADETDSSWWNWLADRDYSVTIKSEVGTLGTILQKTAKSLGEAKGKPGVQVVIGHNVVDQLEDVRESAADLLEAFSDAGPEWQWFSDDSTKEFPNMSERLQAMEKVLDQKIEMTEANWRTYVSDPEYRTMIHGQMAVLGQTLQDLSERLQVPATAAE